MSKCLRFRSEPSTGDVWVCRRDAGHDGLCAFEETGAPVTAPTGRSEGPPVRIVTDGSGEPGPRCGVKLPGVGELPYACVYERGHPGPHWLGVSW